MRSFFIVVAIAVVLPATTHADPRFVPRGWLSPAAIRTVVLARLGDVQRCHERALVRDPNLVGRVVAHFVIGGTGDVISAIATPADGVLGGVAACIALSIRRWRFPPPVGGGIVTVNYPFNLLHAESASPFP